MFLTDTIHLIGQDLSIQDTTLGQFLTGLFIGIDGFDSGLTITMATTSVMDTHTLSIMDTSIGTPVMILVTLS